MYLVVSLLGPQGLRADSSLRARERQVLGSRGEGSLGGVRGQKTEHSELRSRASCSSSAWPGCCFGATRFLSCVPTSLSCPGSSSHLPASPSRTSTSKPCSLQSSLRFWLLPRTGRTIMSGRQRGARRPSRPPSPPWWTRQVGASLGTPPPAPPGPS